MAIFFRFLRVGALTGLMMVLAACSREASRDAAGGSGDGLERDAKQGRPSGRGVSPATGPPMTYQRDPLTGVMQILREPNKLALTTQQVQLSDARVQRVFSSQYALVGPDSTHVVVVRFKERHPEIQQGHSLRINGMIQQLGQELAHWELDPEQKEMLRNHEIFINAITTDANPGQ